ncbi:restriction endonuclease subunit S [Marinobacterium sp. MBR-109]|jgi:type I restriction enzyme S subunit|uniref:restriction endonuclease subunit S n=1 Tax=Marinobacterium sp. MBR-109 TaxID=3156462 RepID=UPI0033996C0E
MSGKYQAYPEYKDSGVEWLGKLPTNWGGVRLKYLAPIVTEKATDRRNPLGLENIESWTGKLQVTDSEFQGDGTRFIAGDLLFGKLRPYLAKVLLAQSEGEAVGDFHVLRPLHNDSRYLQYQMLTREFISIVDGSTYGAKMPRASWEFMGNLTCSRPSLIEQRTIAAFLDHETARIDRLIEKQQRLIELLKEKRQAVISHAVTKGLDPNVPMKDSGVEWLGQVPEHWDVLAVNQATQKITNGYVGPTRDILVESGTPYVQATHIKNGKINFDGGYFVTGIWSLKHKKSILKKGDVLVVQTGAGTGDVGLVSDSEEGYNCHALIILQPIKKKISGDYLSLVLRSAYGQSVLYSIRTGGMHPHLNCSEVKFVKLPVPSTGEQHAISEYVSDVIKKYADLMVLTQRQIQLLQERRIALISAAVTGKIDVRNWQPNTSPQAIEPDLPMAAEQSAEYRV